MQFGFDDAIDARAAVLGHDKAVAANATGVIANWGVIRSADEAARIGADRFSSGVMEYNRIQRTPDEPRVLFSIGLPHNRPRCHSTPLPEGLVQALPVFTTETFTTAMEFCAHAYYGGKPRLNFGGVCLPSGSPNKRILAFPYRTRPPVFSRDYNSSALLLLTFLDVSISSCRTLCRCPGDDDYDTIDLHTSGNAEEQDSMGEADVQLLGTLPVEEDLRSSPQDQQCPAETKTCAGPGSSNKCSDGCRCQIDGQSVNPAQFNPNQLTAFCVDAYTFSQLNRGHRRKHPRNLGGTLDGQRPYCPCNVTYVSHACCESNDGLVWEVSHMKVGELASL